MSQPPSGPDDPSTIPDPAYAAAAAEEDELPEDTDEKYSESTAEYDPELDDPEDPTTGYEDDTDAEGDDAEEVEVEEYPEEEEDVESDPTV